MSQTTTKSATTPAKKPVDIHVGERLRRLRILNSLSQSQLAQSLGLTFQQVQKYEKGVNRLSATRLFEVSNLFDVEPNYFFEGLATELSTAKPSGFEIKRMDEENPFQNDRNLKLVSAFERIEDEAVRESIYNMIRSVAKQDQSA